MPRKSGELMPKRICVVIIMVSTIYMLDMTYHQKRSMILTDHKYKLPAVQWTLLEIELSRKSNHKWTSL